MKTPSFLQRRRSLAFTLIELLVVIAIIGILAAMLFPAINKAKVAAQKGQAKTDMSNLGMAIKSYESDYNGRLPAPGIPTGLQDVTYGYTGPAVTGQYVCSNNRDVVAVLLNFEKFSDGTTTTNAGKVFNPRALTPWNAKQAADNNSAGVGPDGNFRDPWGNQYRYRLESADSPAQMASRKPLTTLSAEAHGPDFNHLDVSSQHVVSRLLMFSRAC